MMSVKSPDRLAVLPTKPRRFSHGLLRTLKRVDSIWIVVTLAYVVFFLARLPDLRAVILYFAPPLLAGFILTRERGRLTIPTLRFFCRVFLGMIAVGVLLGEQQVLFANLKPQFAGLPPQQDRVLTFYLMAYFFFLLVFCPAYLSWYGFGESLFRHLRGKSARVSFRTCCLGSVTWLMAMGALAALIVNGFEKLF